MRFMNDEIPIYGFWVLLKHHMTQVQTWVMLQIRTRFEIALVLFTGFCLSWSLCVMFKVFRGNRFRVIRDRGLARGHRMYVLRFRV